MSRKSSRGKYNGFQYVNHMSSGSLGREPTSWKEFLQDIGENRLKQFPTQQQPGADCFAYGPKIALTVATCGALDPDVACFANYDGGSNEQSIKYLNKKYKDFPQGTLKSGNNTIECNYEKLSQQNFANFILEPLKENLVVMGIQKCGYPEIMRGEKVNPYIEFNVRDNEHAHTVCVIGCYNDREFGKCLVTKTSNYPSEYNKKKRELYNWEPNGKYASIFGKKKIETKYIGYALLKIDSFLCNNFSKTDGKYRQIINEVYLYPKPTWPIQEKKPAAKKPKPRKKMKQESDNNNRPRRSTRIQNSKKNGETEVTNQMILLKF